MKKNLVLLVSLFGLSSYGLTSERVSGVFWSYEVVNNNARIVYYIDRGNNRKEYWAAVSINGYFDQRGTRPSGDLIVPSTLGGCIVKTIGTKAFQNCSDLTSVSFPSSINSIEGSAFYYCSDLTIYLPNDIGVISIAKNAISENVQVVVNEIAGYYLSWTNNQGEVLLDPFHSTSAVTVSPWWRKIVSVTFDANGGVGEMAQQSIIEGNELSLVTNDFTRIGYDFQGWGMAAHSLPAEKVLASMDGMTLYAIWKPQVPTISLSEGMSFANVSQSVSFSSTATDVTILYTTDGSDPAVNGIEYKEPFAVYESCTVRAIARNLPLLDSDEATVTLTRTEGLSEAVNLYGYLMETDGRYPWIVVTDVSHDGVSCLRSGAIGHGCTDWVQTSVRKAGTVSFWWKAACEEAEEEDGETYWYDYGSFLVDGVVKAQIAGNDTGWQFVSVDVPSGGKHTLRWEYTKDDATTYSPDCIWLDQVQWIPADGSGHTLTTPDPVPYSWLSSYGLGLDSDFESAAKQSIGKQSGNGRTWQVWQDYVAGTDPTNVTSAFTASIEMKDGMPLVTWSPTLNSNGEVRVYTVMGKENLTDAVWQSPTNSTHRFFKVKVALP